MAFLTSITASSITSTQRISFMDWTSSGIPVNWVPGAGIRLAAKASYRAAGPVKWSPVRGGMDDFFKANVALASINREAQGPHMDLTYFAMDGAGNMSETTNSIAFKIVEPFGTWNPPESGPSPLEWAEHGACTMTRTQPLGKISFGGDDGVSSTNYGSAIMGYPAYHGTAAGEIGESFSGTNGIVGALSASWGLSSDGKSITPGTLELSVNRGGYNGSVAGGRAMTKVIRITSSGTTQFSSQGYDVWTAGDPLAMGANVRILGNGLSVSPGGPGTPGGNYAAYGGIGFASDPYTGIMIEAMYKSGTHAACKGIAWTTNGDDPDNGYKDGNGETFEMFLNNGRLSLGCPNGGIDSALFSISGALSYLMSLRNDGDTNMGIKIQVGKDTPSVNGDCKWLVLYDGDGDHVSNIQYDTGGDGAAFSSASDMRLKKNIFNTDVRGLDIINQMKFRKFDWDKKACKEANWGKRGHESMWLVAQEVEKVLPEVVGCDENGYKLLGSSFLIKYNSKAIQELSNKVDILEIKNKKLKKELEEKDKDFEMRITNLETKLTKGF